MLYNVLLLIVSTIQQSELAIFVVQLLNHVRLFATPWIVAHQASLSFPISWSFLKLMSIELVLLYNHLILWCPLLLLPSVFPSFRSFSMSQLFTSGDQSIRASVRVLPMNIQSWFLSGLTGLISLPSKRFSRVFSSTTIWKYKN